jgi:hypothetical protein
MNTADPTVREHVEHLLRNADKAVRGQFAGYTIIEPLATAIRELVTTYEARLEVARLKQETLVQWEELRALLLRAVPLIYEEWTGCSPTGEGGRWLADAERLLGADARTGPKLPMNPHVLFQELVRIHTVGVDQMVMQIKDWAPLDMASPDGDGLQIVTVEIAIACTKAAASQPNASFWNRT